MGARTRTVVTVVAAAGVGLGAIPASAQIPEEFTNLRVLREDIPRRELVGLMRSFSFDLGVPCNHCHLGDDPRDLTGYDFASDEREPKRVARGMMELVSRINDELIPAAGRPDGRRVRCVTCHRGIPVPVRIQDLFLEERDEGGIDAAVARYQELRETYYGQAAYDFGLAPLREVIETLAGRDDLSDALTVARLSTELHGQDVQAHALEADVLMRMGRREEAIRAMERAVSLDPDSSFLRELLERMRSGGP